MNDHPSTKMKPERRAALFAAATREFTEHGFEQASLNRIIAGIGMSKSSFYHYFANKTELFEQILQQALAPFAKLVQGFEPKSLSRENFWPAILKAAQGSSALLAQHPEIFAVGRMFHRNLPEPNGICAGMMDVPMALVTRLLEHGKVIGSIRDDLPTSLLLESVLALLMAVDRWAIEHTETYSKAEFDGFHEKIVNMFIRLLAPEG
ncbi:MAG: TetR/AcrR family transcriptional regulator [Rhodobacteraceae bacterium]|nr:TetR/AcrR family transcriptional regulator [Paracoccaceae bacterium]